VFVALGIHLAMLVLYCHLWPAQLCSIFPHHLINGTVSIKNVIEHNVCVLIFSTTFVSTFLIPRRIEWDMVKKMCTGVHVKSHYFCQILMKLEFSLHIFKKNIQISNFMKIHPGGAEVFHADRWVDGQTDGHDEANSYFSQFCECAKKRAAASIKTWNSIKCLHPRDTYI